jgi:hypothetical protein
VDLDLQISPQIFKKIPNGPNAKYSGAGGKLIHKKTRSKKSHDTVPLTLRHNLLSRDKALSFYSSDTDFSWIYLASVWPDTLIYN